MKIELRLCREKVATVGLLMGVFLVGLVSCQSGPNVTVGQGEERKVAGLESFLELEDVQGVDALKWVEERNKESEARLGQDQLFRDIKADVLAIIQAKDRIPSISVRGTGATAVVYNFWQDEKNQKGIFRSQLMSDFKKGSDVWQTIFDLDEIAKAEKESWVYKGLDCAPTLRDRCLLYLSRGGGDAIVAREFDLVTKDFVKGGVFLPEAKMNIDWRDDDTLWVGAPAGPGTVSDAGYPIVMKLYTRGTDLAKAPIVFKGQVTDVGVWANTLRSTFIRDGVTVDQRVDLVSRYLTSNEGEHFVRRGDGSLEKIPLPLNNDVVGLTNGMLLFTIKKDAAVFGKPLKSGVVYAFDVEAWMQAPSAIVTVETVFEPSVTQTFSGISTTKERALISYLDNVRGRLAFLERVPPKSKTDIGRWKLNLVKLPSQNGSVSMGFSSSDETNFTVFFSDFLTPYEMYLGDGLGALSKLRSSPKRFNASGMKVETHRAISKDGTKIPYFLILPKGVNRKSGKTPTIINAYGGFEIPSVPYYMGAQGKVWMERGGAYVVANIRGGGEFGPKWHLAALKEKRQNAFDDLYAVAEHVIQSGLTSSAHLGFRGGSNGGLLAGVAMTQRPELFNAILCQVPLLDMLRFHKLLAGASWVGEYGDPEIPSERSYLEKYSPLQNLKPGVKYPEPFITTSTRDDRVHPGHARRMVARMMEMGLPVLYYENIEGGHAGAATLESKAALSAREFRYLWDRLK